jgi:hypothetical protein
LPARAKRANGRARDAGPLLAGRRLFSGIGPLLTECFQFR